MDISKLLTYFRERFPVAGAILLGVGFSFYAVGISDVDWSADEHIVQSFLLTLFFAAFLLRQRTSDEFKDFLHDTKNFPSRPLQRGLVSKRQLIVIGLFALIIELSIAAYLGSIQSFVLYLLIFFYSLMMLKEFFIGKWLERHFNLYLLLHQFIFVLFAIWFVSLFNTEITANSIAWIAAFLTAMMSAEIARKFELRKDSNGKIVYDTYPAMWGEINTKNILQILILSSGTLLAFAETNLLLALISTFTALMIAPLSVQQSGIVKIITALHLVFLPGLGVLL